MKTKLVTLLMSIVFGITQIGNIGIGILLKRVENIYTKPFLFFVAFSIIGVTLIGALVGMLFSKNYERLPFSNIYLKTSTFLVTLNLGLFLAFSLPKGINVSGVIDLVITMVFAIGGGCLFSLMYSKMNK